MKGAKNGSGLTKEQAAKRDYFDMFKRHLRHLISINVIYSLANILFFGGSIYLFVSYFSGDNIISVINAFLAGQPVIIPIVPFIPLMLTGPFTAGFTYVVRNIAKQEHTFVFSDFLEHSKKNFGYALITSVLQYLVLYLLIQLFFFYNAFFAASSLPSAFLYTLFAIVIILYTIMFFYIYPIMVTFDMKYKIILKNAWTFTILKLPQNFLIFVLLFAIHCGIIYLTCIKWLTPLLYLLLLAIILAGFTAFTANYYIWHVLKKYIIRFVEPENNREDMNENN